MGQSECIEILKRSKKPLITREIAERLKQSIGLVSRSLRTLFKHGEIIRRYKQNSLHILEWVSK